MYKEHFISGLITAAGSGTRMEAHIPKLELKINNKEIISYTLEKFLSLEVFDEIILVTSKDLLDLYKERYYKAKFSVEGPTDIECKRKEIVCVSSHNFASCFHVWFCSFPFSLDMH